MKHGLKVGDKIILDWDKTWYVKAISDRFVICTRPYNFKKTVWYTILDFEENIRGTHNFVFNPYDFKNQADIDLCLKDLLDSEIEISHRNRVGLEDIVKVQKAVGKVKE